jgi:hypothetical protein
VRFLEAVPTSMMGDVYSRLFKEIDLAARMHQQLREAREAPVYATFALAEYARYAEGHNEVLRITEKYLTETTKMLTHFSGKQKVGLSQSWGLVVSRISKNATYLNKLEEYNFSNIISVRFDTVRLPSFETLTFSS